MSNQGDLSSHLETVERLDGELRDEGVTLIENAIVEFLIQRDSKYPIDPEYLQKRQKDI